MTQIHHRSAFTLVELLVALGVIALLVALLMPAIQQSREAARRTQCRNNLKQLALACLEHEGVHRQLPTGGWGSGWTADADRGYDRRQPGSWLFVILPFIEQRSVHQMGTGLSGPPKLAAHKRRNETPVPLFLCPSRRSGGPWPVRGNTPEGRTFFNADLSSVMAKNDYAANLGTRKPTWPPAETTLDAAHQWPWPASSEFNGVCFLRSEVRMAFVTDGASQTYLIGEKRLDALEYESGQDVGDDEGAFTGINADVNRSSGPDHPPYQDYPGISGGWGWGSAHADGFHMALVDGSVRQVNYAIDRGVHARLGSRNDGEPVGDDF